MLTAIAIKVGLTLLGLGGAWVGKHLAALLATKTKNSKVRAALTLVSGAVSVAVKSVYQTMRDRMERDHGTLTTADKSALKKAAVESVWRYLGENGLADVQAALGMGQHELDLYISDRVEAQLHDVKVNVLAARNAGTVAAPASP